MMTTVRREGRTDALVVMPERECGSRNPTRSFDKHLLGVACPRPDGPLAGLA
jgi:hypothetical protein